MKTISRDPFARTETVRETVLDQNNYGRDRTCAWCGTVRTTKTGTRYLYRYGTSPDAGRLIWSDRLFCSIGCYRTFHS